MKNIISTSPLPCGISANCIPAMLGQSAGLLEKNPGSFLQLVGKRTSIGLSTLEDVMKEFSFHDFSGRLRRLVFGLSPKSVDFEQRGFLGADAVLRRRLDAVCTSFLAGYHHSLEAASLPDLEARLAGVDSELRGFAFEGAAMGLALLERVLPWRAGLVRKFLQGRGDAHAYMIHVGMGWVWARVPFAICRGQKNLDPLLGWLAFDGWGFHEGFFHWRKYITGQPAPKKLSGYERRVFDQGFGRSLWFVLGGNVELIAATILNFSAERRGDLWSGLGLAATYAGMASEENLQKLRQRAGSFQPQLAQGAAFAAKARQRAGNLTDYTGLAVKIFCDASAADAAHVTDAALENLPADAAEPAYEIWRRRIQNHFQNQNLPQPQPV